MAQSPQTESRRFSLESHQLRRKLFTSPSPKRQKRGYNWTANRKSRRFDDFGRHRGTWKLHDGANA